jgi:nucleoside-diphosphate-sugar epimerase
MRIVILGGTGNIGTALVRALGGDHDVHVVARRLPAETSSLGANVTAHAADIARDSLDVVAAADAVVHLAWLLQPTHQPEVMWRTNVVGTERVLDAVRRGGVGSLVVSSSIAAYSPVDDHAPVDEGHPTHGASAAAYCREKAYVERLLDVFEREAADVRVARVRPAFVFQRAAASEQRRLFAGPLLPGSAVRPGLVPVLPVPRGLRMQTVHADDVAEAIRLVVESRASGPFNIAADDVLDGGDLARLFKASPVAVPSSVIRGLAAAAWHARLAPAPPDLYDALLRLPTMSTARAKSELGWSPKSTAAEALQTVLEGMRSGAGGDTPPLQSEGGGPLRWREVVTRVGGSDRV